MTDFTLHLYKDTFKEPRNHVVGHVSLHNALAALLLGSDGSSKKELVQLLCEKDDSKVHSRLEKQFESIRESAGESVFLCSNAIYSSNGVKEEFGREATKFYDCLIKQLPMRSEPAACIRKINKFVEDGTKGKITEIIDSLHLLVEVVIVNAVYFKGLWKNKFNPDLTVPLPFQLMDGTKVEAPSMRAQFRVPFLESHPKLACQAIQLEFDKSKIRCLIALPNESMSLTDFIEKLDQDKEAFKYLLNIQNYWQSEVKLTLPKFKIASSINIKSVLEEKGLKDIFTDGVANFSKMTDKDVHVSEILHKAVFEFNEDGAEAAAATAIEIIQCSARIPKIHQFKVDRPFLFSLVSEDGYPLFMGHIVNPTLNE